MDYQKAKNIRGKSLSSLITDKIVSGGGIGSSISESLSEKSKARMTGLKEKFDPLNIAKTLTGGSRLAPAILGRLTGRSPEAINYFAGDPKKKRQLQTEGDSEAIEFATKTLGSIYTLMMHMEQVRKREESDSNENKRTEEEQEEKRNQELIKALTARRAPKKKVKKDTEEVKKKEQKQDQTKRKEETKKVEDKAKEKVKAEPVKKPPEKAPPTAQKVPPVIPTGAKGLVLGALVAAGYTKQAQANVMANVEKESAFKPRSEELEKYSAKTLFKLYGPPGIPGGQPDNGKNKIRFKTIDEAQAVVDKGPEAVGDVIYGGRMGNDKPGDGYKYRGRGFIQITGKENYQKIGKMIGEDLVANPDLANDPKIAAKIIPAYFKLKIKKPEDLENIDKVNAAVGSASEKSKEDRKVLASVYAAELSTGNQINAASTENRELKKEIDKETAPVIINNNSTTQTKSSPTPIAPSGDDRSAYSKKAS